MPSSTSSSPHHVGAVETITDEALVQGLSDYVKSCRTPGVAFDLGAYNLIKKSQAVKGEPLLDVKALLYAMLELLPGLRVHNLQLRRALLQVNADMDSKCNGSSRPSADWARATSVSVGVILAHTRRLRNKRLFDQCLRRVKTVCARTALQLLRSDVQTKCLEAPGGRPLKRALQDEFDDAACVVQFDEEGWPIDPDCAEDAWPQFSSDDEVPKAAAPSARVATGPARSSMTPKQRKILAKGLERSTEKALTGAVQLKKELVESSKTEGTSNGEVSMGRIRLGCYSQKSYIQLYLEDEYKWKSVCYCDERKCAGHAALMKKIFKSTLNHDWDEDTMRRERDRLVEQL